MLLLPQLKPSLLERPNNNNHNNNKIPFRIPVLGGGGGGGGHKFFSLFTKKKKKKKKKRPLSRSLREGQKNSFLPRNFSSARSRAPFLYRRWGMTRGSCPQKKENGEIASIHFSNLQKKIPGDYLQDDRRRQKIQQNPEKQHPTPPQEKQNTTTFFFTKIHIRWAFFIMCEQRTETSDAIRSKEREKRESKFFFFSLLHVFFFFFFSLHFSLSSLSTLSTLPLVTPRRSRAASTRAPPALPPRCC